MSTIRVAKRPRFTTVDRRTVNDPRLSFKALGLLLWLLDKPNDWRVDRDAIVNARDRDADGDGIAAVRSALAELEQYGYLDRHRVRGEGGTWTWEHVLHEVPLARNPPAENAPVEPTSGNSANAQVAPLARNPPAENAPSYKELRTEDELKRAAATPAQGQAAARGGEVRVSQDVKLAHLSELRVQLRGERDAVEASEASGLG